ncbi:hypothetical protein O1611_g926 [Lasiodiplodia mahajangana]|uniref:Uncharacterized protein n=1 Tax=Lasiodiplodia mahajangana TaxID=1108764 RepID=A0ACC2JYU8_9PEZI|nr:hypothetical protein O1611_g926 [Lasiodiplodia mahajangana]
MATEPLIPNDPRVEHKNFPVGDYVYHYMLAKPKGLPVATVVLIHGWPDLGMGWRFQVPYLLSLGLQVIVPDMLGYGQTSAPASPEEYTMKKMTAQIAALIRENTDQPVILGGHDWGGAFVWRMTLYYPQLIRAVFSFCVPYFPPEPVVVSTEELVKAMPNFRYQLFLADGSVEAAVDSSASNLLAFMNGNYGGTTPDGDLIFTAEDGIRADRFSTVGPSPIVAKEMIDYYVQQYLPRGLRGPCNWYRTRELNGQDEVQLARDQPDFQFKTPAMIVMAEKDFVLRPELAEGQEKFFASGLKKEVVSGASHWVLIEKPRDANKHIRDFISGVLGTQL